MECSPYYESDVLAYFDGHAEERALYEAFFRRLCAQFPACSVKVQKSQISFYNRHLFAAASLPVRRKKDWPKTCILVTFGLSHRLDHFPGQMSGGQQQRAGIARAFIARPDVVFADEPTGNLDSKTTAEIMEMICAFARRYHQTIILVTHDPEMAAYADRIVTLIDGEIVGNQVNQKEKSQYEA